MWKRIIVCVSIYTPVLAIAADQARLPTYGGTISDAHSHVHSRLKFDRVIQQMDKSDLDMILIMPKGKAKGVTGDYRDKDVAKLAERYPGRVVPAIGFQNDGWRSESFFFMHSMDKKAASGKYQWMGETSLRGGLGGKVHVSPTNPKLREVLDISACHGLPVTIHNNSPPPEELEQFREALAHNPAAVVIWAPLVRPLGASSRERIS